MTTPRHPVAERFVFLFEIFAEELRHIVRRPSVLMVLLTIPVLYPLATSWLYARNQPDARPTLVVDDDGSGLSRRLLVKLRGAPALRIDAQVPTLAEGWARIRSRAAEVLVYVPRGLSAKVKRGEPAEVALWVDTANVLTYGVSFPAVQEAVTALNAELGVEHLQLRGLPTHAARARATPLVKDERALFHPSAAYGDFLVPGVFLVALHQVLLIGLAFSFGFRKERAGFVRSARFPFTEIEGRALAQLGFHAAGAAFVVFVVFPLFGWTLREPWALYALLCALLVCLVPLGVLVAHFVPDRVAAFQLLMFASVPLFMVSGYLWPFEQMPEYLQWLACVFPSTPALQAFRLFTHKGASLAEAVPYLQWMAALGGAWALVAVVAVRATAPRLREGQSPSACT